MFSFPRLTAIVLPFAVLALAASARADDRCTGTLCDLYYGKTSSFDDKPTAPQAPTAVTVPRPTIMGMFSGTNAQQPAAPAGAGSPNAAAAQPAKRPTIGVGGGGLAAMARGEAPERCTGTFCDLYYGQSSSFEGDKPSTREATASTSAPAQVEASADVTAGPALRMDGFQTKPEPPRCVAKGRDPWSCFR